MNGLLKNQFYGALGSAAVLLAFFVAAGIALLITGNPSLLNLYVLVAATAFAFNAVAGFRKEASSKWGKYELTAPVTRKDIVKSRYVSHTIWVLFGMLLSALFVALTIAVHGNRYFYYIIRDPLTLFCAGAGIALLMGAIFYPVIYLFGTDKSEIVIVISLLGAVGINAGITWIMNAAYGFRPLSDPEYYLNVAIYVAITITAFGASYLFTTLIYRKKEY